MAQKRAPQYLAGKLLIAMPGMRDPRFAKSVVLMLDHDESRATGVVINKPAGFMQLGLDRPGEGEQPPETEQIPVHYGGPIDKKVAIIVHSSDRDDYESTLRVNDDLCVTSTPHILEDIWAGTGPQCRLFVLGYAGWGPGQLEGELQENSWLVGNGSLELVFKTSASDKWNAAIQALGINPSKLSTTGGIA
ncbi:MAG: YqgE/AlgH family protein [Rhodobacteraceae bacterium]|nr:YqgE/AlgH family protein [Paracoccaceae bacterium]